MNERFLKYVKGWYFIYFGFILMFRGIGPYLLFPTRYDTLLFWPAGIAGVVLIIIDVIIAFREKNLKKYDWLLFAFIDAMLVSSLMIFTYVYSETIKLIMW
ncbi:hypothetical protein [Enterococcus faecium]|uniref:hypothetical protein n=1 Tax=Enterococcus faecium TaxID=1352 RepID=UPI00217D0E61|nr:hypothetical protein [Enterococcus faecium]